MKYRSNSLQLHRLTITLLAILVTVSADGVFAKNRSETIDTLLTTIKEKSISEMTDGEFRYFFEYQKEIDDFNPCEDNFIKGIAQKEVKEMTKNEFEYFDEFILECDNVDPCSLKQYLQIKDKKPFDMTTNELEFYNGCTRECDDYMETYHPTKKQRRKKCFRIVGLGATVVGVMLGSVAYSLFKL